MLSRLYPHKVCVKNEAQVNRAQAQQMIGGSVLKDRIGDKSSHAFYANNIIGNYS